MISWKTVYWRGIVIQDFVNEQEVADVLRQNAPTSGLYIMPRPSDPESVAEQFPLVLSGINLAGKRPLWVVLAGSFVNKVLMAFIGTWLLLHHSAKMSYAKRVGFFVLIGCLIAL